MRRIVAKRHVGAVVCPLQVLLAKHMRAVTEAETSIVLCCIGGVQCDTEAIVNVPRQYPGRPFPSPGTCPAPTQSPLQHGQRASIASFYGV